MESLSQKKDPEIKGYVKIKRKRFWAERYAEIQNNIFFYYKSREDTTARGIIQLKGATVQERKGSSGEFIIAIIRINSIEKNNETLLIKNEYEVNHKAWLKALLDSINQTAIPKSQDSGPAEKTSNQNSSIENPQQNFVQNEKRLSLVGFDPTRASATRLDTDLIKNNLGSSAITLKANVKHFIETDENFVLSDVHSDIRVLGKKLNTKAAPRKLTEENKTLGHVIKLTEKLRTMTLDMKEKLGDLLFTIFSIVGVVIFITLFYLILELTNWHTFLVTIALTFNLIALPIIYEKTIQKMNLQIKNIDVTKDFLNNSNYKLKAMTAIPFTINEILLVLKNMQQRKYWHSGIQSLNFEDRSIKAVYGLPNKTTYTEKFIQSVYQQDKYIYVVEHNNTLNPIRVFEIRYNKRINNTLLINYYVTANSQYLSSINPALNPILLNGLKMFLYELRNDNKSFIWEYIGSKQLDIEVEGESSDSSESVNSEDKKQADEKKGVSKRNIDNSEAAEASKLEKVESFLEKKEQEILSKKEEDKEAEEAKRNEPELDISSLSPFHRGIYDKLKKAQERLESIASLQSSAGWTYVSTKEEVTVHIKVDAASGITWTRGEGKIEKSIEEIRSFIVDLNLKTQYDSMFEGGKTVEEFLKGYTVTYQKFKGIFPVGARDFILGGGTEYKSDGTLVLIGSSIEHPEYPPFKGYVRGETHVGGWVLTPVKDQKSLTNCVYITIADPKGSIPKKIVEMASSKQALVVLGVKKALEKQKK